MKIFVTGSTGFIGQNLVQRYKDHEVFEFHRKLNLRDSLRYFKPDLIINCAAEIYNRDEMFAVNVSLVKECLDYVKEFPNTKMIQLGSSSEYGPVNRPTKETDPIQALDMYSGTKGMATLLCQSYARSYNLDIIVVRPYSPYGPGERPHRLFPALWRSFKLDKPMDLVLGVHDFCYIDDFVDALNSVIESDNRTPGELINISSGVQVSNTDVLTAFRKVSGKEGLVDVKNNFTTPPIWTADISHIKTKYKWRPKISLEQGISKFLEKANY
jgi:nucleoside-diphosphate-sugar epimerase